MGRGGAVEGQGITGARSSVSEPWHELYASHPEQFLSLKEPLSIPTEEMLLAVSWAGAQGELKQVEFEPDLWQKINEGAKILRTLSGLGLPKVSFWTFDRGGELERVFAEHDQRRAFSCAAEPQMRGSVVLAPQFLDSGDEIEIASVTLHEIQHGAQAMTADAPSVAYTQPLTAAVDEMSVGFTELSIREWLSTDGNILSREGFETVAAELDLDSKARIWTDTCFELGPGLETPELCRHLGSLAVDALRSADDEAVADLLNSRSGRRLTSDQWLQRLQED